MEKNDTFSRLLFEALELEQLPACELCGREAVVVCAPDAAFLCWACDATVHSANFLAARHVRWLACGGCHRLDSARRISGARPEPVRSLCASCHPAHSPSFSSSSCVSTSQSTATGGDQEEKKPAAAKRRRVDVDEMAEGILLDSSELRGIRSGRRCMGEAAEAVGSCEWLTTADLSSKVAFAIALWSTMKRHEGELLESVGERVVLRRLEQWSGLQWRLILMVEPRIARMIERVRGTEEGSAESA